MSVILFTVSVAMLFALLCLEKDVRVVARRGHHLGYRIQADSVEEVGHADPLDQLADALAVLAVLVPKFPDARQKLIDGLIQFCRGHERNQHTRQQRAFEDRSLGADHEGGAALLARPQRLGHRVDAVHAAHAVGVVDGQLSAVPLHALGGTEVAHVFLYVESGGGVVRHLRIILLDLVLPDADHGKIRARRGGDTIVRTAGALDLEFVGKSRTVHLVLMGLRQVVAQFHGVVARPLAAGLAHAAGGRPHGRPRAAKIEARRRQLLESRLELIGAGSQQNYVARGTVQVRQSRAVPLPDVGQRSQRITRIKPAGGMIYAERVEVRHLRKLVGNVAVAADYAAAVAADSDHASVLPMPFLLLVRQLELAEQIVASGILLAGLLDFRDKTGPRSLFELIQQFGFAFLIFGHWWSS